MPNIGKKNIDILEKMVDQEINKVDSWMRHNRLSLNYSKTVYMIFSSDKKQSSSFRVQIGSHLINRVNSTKYLGMHLDNKLNWDTHISKLESKLSCYSGIFFVEFESTWAQMNLRWYISALYPPILSTPSLHLMISSNTELMLILNRWAVKKHLASNSTAKILPSVNSETKHSVQATTYTLTTTCQKQNAHVSVLILYVGMLFLFWIYGCWCSSAKCASHLNVDEWL